MKERPPLRLVEFDTQPDPAALSTPDRVVVGLLSATFLGAPWVAATFPTPPQTPLMVPTTAGDYLIAAGMPLLWVLIGVAAGVLLWREWRHPVTIGAVRFLSGATALLCASALLSLTRSPAMGQSLNALAALMAIVLVGAMVSRLSRDARGFQVFLLTLAAAGSLLAGYGVNEFLMKWRSGDPQLRSFATFFNPNFLAGYLLLTLPVTLGAFAGARERVTALALGAGIGLQSACLMFTVSRAGALAGMAAVVIWVLLAAFAGALRSSWKRVVAGVAICALCGGIAAAPTLGRIARSAPGMSTAPSTTAGVRSHSETYRRLTWEGTFRMALSNPVVGGGVGCFDLVYPRYALAAPTAHAHNSFLQWAAETGFPGLLGLLSVLAAAAAFGVHVLRLQGLRVRSLSVEQRSGALRSLSVPEPACSLNLAGLLTALTASMLHCLFDSDWYVVCTALTLSVVIALLVAQARDLAPLATLRPAPLSLAARVTAGILIAFVLWRAGTVGVARYAQTEGRDALYRALAAAQQGGDPGTLLFQARRALERAVAADPLDPEARLLLAQTLMGDPGAARQELERATRVAQTGKTFYRLGRFHAQRRDWLEAVKAFEQARQLEPKNLQNLRQLADALMQLQREEEARTVFETIVALQQQAYGQVRAIPEMVETDFAYGYLGLARISVRRREWERAIEAFSGAARVFEEYWQKRRAPENLQRALSNPERHTEILTDYEKTLREWADAAARAGRNDVRARVLEQLQRFQQERTEDARAAEAEEQGNTTP
ncbi:MAG: O-antigen ligase family protein [Chloroherpetonaceae bacterium]|nr:O-antigen ligase family protein [Chthonomonadaceae bacterium]MDW8208704.1 O-antigen ligase family protein [Chloroherpetonaceae bacterium]